MENVNYFTKTSVFFDNDKFLENLKHSAGTLNFIGIIRGISSDVYVYTSDNLNSLFLFIQEVKLGESKGTSNVFEVKDFSLLSDSGILNLLKDLNLEDSSRVVMLLRDSNLISSGVI